MTASFMQAWFACHLTYGWTFIKIWFSKVHAWCIIKMAKEVGKLMHDFSCTDPDDMNYEILAKKQDILSRMRKGAQDPGQGEVLDGEKPNHSF